MFDEPPRPKKSTLLPYSLGCLGSLIGGVALPAIFFGGFTLRSHGGGSDTANGLPAFIAVILAFVGVWAGYALGALVGFLISRTRS